MATGGEGPFNYIGNTMAEWKMRQLLRLLEEGGRVTVVIEIPPRGETEKATAHDGHEHGTGTSDTDADSESDNPSGDAGGEAAE